MKITSVHEHAEYYPMLSEEQLVELAADIQENGQRDPITVTSDGILIDGRNRWEACKRLGIEPKIEVQDVEDVGAFVRSRNERRHQPTGSRAMSTALSLEHDGKRKKNDKGDGYWARGSLMSRSGHKETESSHFRKRVNEAGLVLDLLPDLAWQVVDGTVALDDAYRQACAERDNREAERIEKEARKKRAMEAEAYARDKFTNDENAKQWLEAKPQGAFKTMESAYAAYEAEVEEVRAAEEKRRREIEKKQREHEQALGRDANRLRAFLDGWETAWAMRTDEHRDEVLSRLEKPLRERFLKIERETTWPTERL